MLTLNLFLKIYSFSCAFNSKTNDDNYFKHSSKCWGKPGTSFVKRPWYNSDFRKCNFLLIIINSTKKKWWPLTKFFICMWFTFLQLRKVISAKLIFLCIFNKIYPIVFIIFNLPSAGKWGFSFFLFLKWKVFCLLKECVKNHNMYVYW